MRISSNEETENIIALLNLPDLEMNEIGMVMLDNVVYEHNETLWGIYSILRTKSKKSKRMKKFMEEMIKIGTEELKQLEV